MPRARRFDILLEFLIEDLSQLSINEAVEVENKENEVNT